MAINTAAWLTGKHVRPLSVASAPMPDLKPGSVIVVTRALAINPVDAAIQTAGIIATDYPIVMGLDGTGIVHAVSDDVANVKVGDRVLAFTAGGTAPGGQGGTFQQYFCVHSKYVAVLPDSVKFTEGVVVTSCLTVASISLFDEKCLAFSRPLAAGQVVPNGKIVLIWAGATVVGSCAIQMAKLAGYEVWTTSSEHNFDYCKDLGAAFVFNYKRPGIVDEIVQKIDAAGKSLAGAFGAHLWTANDCAQVVRRLGDSVEHTRAVGTVIPEGYGFSVPEDWPEGVKFCWLFNKSDAAEWVWREWITKALADGRMKCKPDADVVGKGLEFVQEALDRWSQGVSASKIVVEL
nr:hypothetical protein B0A51_08488 [Rachicladosporium sp. CCFEE 5018]OQO28384.1 hypothetical protein B0A51_04877 [Rachicladosporium sp. CCFEE 5018]OQO28569.1 hypothetical protein B0A51_05616 [Rachicladosporium sp. CCFEE 5018]